MFEQTLPIQVTPFWEFDGVFLMKRPTMKLPGADHYGVLIAGKALNFLWFPAYKPVVVHRTSEMRVELAEMTGQWLVLDQVRSDQAQTAVARARAVFNDPQYYLLTNNCEHTARYIFSGEKRSTQVGNFVIALAVGAAIWSASRREN